MPRYALPLAALLAISLLGGCVAFRPLVAEVEKDGRKQTLTGYADPGQIQKGTIRARNGGYICGGGIIRTQPSHSPLSCDGEKGIARIPSGGEGPGETHRKAAPCPNGYRGRRTEQRTG